MTDREDASINEAVETAIDVVTATATAAAGIFFAPELALPIAAAGGLAPHVANVVASRMRRRVEGIQQGLIAGGVNLDQLAEAIETSDRAMDLWRRVVRAGLETSWQQKCRALGRALAEGTLRDQGFDRDARVVKALDAIEKWDFAMLDFMERLPERRTQDQKDKAILYNSPGVASLDDLRAEFPVGDVVEFLIDHFENNGLAHRTIGTEPVQWVLTLMAREALRLLRASADNED